MASCAAATSRKFRLVGVGLLRRLRGSFACKVVTTAPLARAEQDFSAPGPAIVTRRKAVERLRSRATCRSRSTNSRARSPTAGEGDGAEPRPDLAALRLADFHRRDSPDMDAFLADVVAVTRQIVRELVDAGRRYIQIDAPGYMPMSTKSRSTACVRAARIPSAISSARSPPTMP